MCVVVALVRSEIPEKVFAAQRLDRLVHVRAGQEEVRFFARAVAPALAVWHDGELIIARWGNARGQSSWLPRTAWTWQSSVDEGMWQGSGALAVEIPATYASEGGAWYRVRIGIRGLLVHDEHREPVAFMLVEPASHYYRVMTRSNRMPVFLAERI